MRQLTYIGYVQWPSGFRDLCERESAEDALAEAKRLSLELHNAPFGECIAVRRCNVAPPDTDRRLTVLVPALYGIGGNAESAKLAHAGFAVGALGGGVIKTPKP